MKVQELTIGLLPRLVLPPADVYTLTRPGRPCFATMEGLIEGKNDRGKNNGMIYTDNLACRR